MTENTALLTRYLYAALRVRLSRLLFRWAKRLDPAWYYRDISITTEVR